MNLDKFVTQLIEEMKANGITYSLMAKCVGLSRQGLYRRLESPGSFTLVELHRLVALSVTAYGSGLWVEFISQDVR